MGIGRSVLRHGGLQLRQRRADVRAADGPRGGTLTRRLRCEPLEDRRMLTIFTVNSLLDVVAADGLVTLREALEAANTNVPVYDAPAGTGAGMDTIRFALALFADGENPVPGRITLGGTQLEIRGNLAMEGPGADLLAVDANEQSRVIYVAYQVTVAISGMTITGGRTDHGCGIHNDGGAVSLANSSVVGNSATRTTGYAAGIFNDAGTLTISGSKISANSSGGSAGGILSTGILTVTNSSISENVCQNYGGGICAELTSAIDSKATIINSTISGNVAAGGGGIFHGSGALTVTNSTVSDNSALDWKKMAAAFWLRLHRSW